MSEDNTKTIDTNKNLVSQIEAELEKSAREALKSKVKELVKKRNDAQKVVNSINLEIQKAVEDFEAGL